MRYKVILQSIPCLDLVYVLISELIVEDICGDREAAYAAGDEFWTWHPVLLVKLDMTDS